MKYFVVMIDQALKHKLGVHSTHFYDSTYAMKLGQSLLS